MKSPHCFWKGVFKASYSWESSLLNVIHSSEKPIYILIGAEFTSMCKDAACLVMLPQNDLSALFSVSEGNGDGHYFLINIIILL